MIRLIVFFATTLLTSISWAEPLAIPTNVVVDQVPAARAHILIHENGQVQIETPFQIFTLDSGPQADFLLAAYGYVRHQSGWVFAGSPHLFYYDPPIKRFAGYDAYRFLGFEKSRFEIITQPFTLQFYPAIEQSILEEATVRFTVNTGPVFDANSRPFIQPLRIDYSNLPANVFFGVLINDTPVAVSYVQPMGTVFALVRLSPHALEGLSGMLEFFLVPYSSLLVTPFEKAQQTWRKHAGEAMQLLRAKRKIMISGEEITGHWTSRFALEVPGGYFGHAFRPDRAILDLLEGMHLRLGDLEVRSALGPEPKRIQLEGCETWLS